MPTFSSERTQAFYRTKKGAAVIAGCLFLFAMIFLIGRKSPDRSVSMAPSTIGEVLVLVGEADHRAPRSMEITKLVQGAPILAGELVLAHDASQVTLKYHAGATLRLQPGARVVAERDPAVEGGVIATVLEGDVDVVSLGTPKTFKLFKNGRDITLTAGFAPAASVIVSGSAGRTFPAGRESAVVVTATTPVEASTPVPVAHVSDEVGGGAAASDSLSNDEIRKGLRSAGGFFQRCYLTYLNRVKPAASDRASTITVGFMISNMGRVRDARIVRSDIGDSTLNNCLLETVERTPFRAFKGNDIPVLEFPIELQ